MTSWRSKHVAEHHYTLNEWLYISIDLSFVYIRIYCCVDSTICDILTHIRMHSIKIMIMTSAVHGKQYRIARSINLTHNTTVLPRTKTPHTGRKTRNAGNT